MGKTENYLSAWNFNICGNLKIILMSPYIYIYIIYIYIYITAEFLSSMTKAKIMQVAMKSNDNIEKKLIWNTIPV